MAKAMTPPAAEELLNVIMLDDFVARRKALDVWTRRWVATMEVLNNGTSGPHGARAEMLNEVAEGLLVDAVGCVEFGKRVGKMGYALRMHVLLQKPRELCAAKT